MKTLLICLCIQIVLFAVGLSQERTDVIYLKNGDVRKGVIIENVPNDYIRIEMSDGSIFTIKYSDIQKMTKEAKAEQATQSVSGPSRRGTGLMAKTGDFGVSAGLWFAGDVNYGDLGVTIEKNTGFLLRVFYDAYVAEKIGVGTYFNFSPTSSEASDYGATMYEFGAAIKARFPLADGSAIVKPGLNIGYRRYSSDLSIMDDVSALGLNASVELQFDIRQVFAPYVEIGFLSQAAGGNEITDITFPPIFYLAAGATF